MSSSTGHRSAKFVALAGILVLATAIGSIGLAAGSGASPDLERSLEASSMRWALLGESFEAARAEAAAATMTARYQALAAWYAKQGLISAGADGASP
jgi:hypothetical protein